MRTLSSTLLLAQKAASRIPYVSVVAQNKMTDVVRLKWERLYEGSEDSYYHAVAMPGDGSLIRVRVTPPSDNCKLYRQRVGSPGPQSDFSAWTYTNQYNCQAVAAASCGSEVSIFWVNLNRELHRFKSTDSGVTWGSAELLDYSPTTAVYGIAAAYKSPGDVAVFFTSEDILYVKKCTGGNWQEKSAWGKTTGELTSVAVVYDGDWNLLVTGQNASGDYLVWSLIYGDGGAVSSGTWSELKEFASAPSGGDYEYRSAFLDKPDVYRAYYVEEFNGTQAFHRPFWSHSVGTGFISGLWREPQPFNLSGGYGIAITHHGNYSWLSRPDGVWRANMAETNVELTADVIDVRLESQPMEGSLVVELRNDAGKYNSPGAGNLLVLDTGCQLVFSPGYFTSAGNEVSSGLAFWLDAYEHTSLGGKATLLLHAVDARRLLENWRARYQFRWNKDSEQMSVNQILEFVLARLGLKLEVKSQSSVITTYYPDFTIHPDDSGTMIINRLLSFVPDVVFIEGASVFLVNPLSSDSPVYSYGQLHVILQGKYRTGVWKRNQIRVEGYDQDAGVPIIVDSFSWGQLDKFPDRLMQVTDRNLGTVSDAQSRGGTSLRRAEIDSVSGAIEVPVNCGQQIYDVIDITDSRAGLSAVKRRVMSITLIYRPERGDYLQKLFLGGV